MTTERGHALSLEELSTALAAYAGPALPHARTRRARARWMSGRLAIALALLALIIAGCSYAAGFNPFRGLSAAEHPATSRDSLPPFLRRSISDWNHGTAPRKRLIPGTGRFVRELPNGMRFYAIATKDNGLCVAIAHPPASTAAPGTTTKGGFTCGYLLSQRSPISVTTEQNATDRNGKTIFGTPITYGLAVDGVTAVSFGEGRGSRTIPVKDNVLAFLGAPHGYVITVHWGNGTKTRIWRGPGGPGF